MTQFLNKFWALGLGIAVIAVAVLTDSLLVRNHLDQETGGELFSQIVHESKFDFVPIHDNINIIVLRLKNPGLLNTDPYEVLVKKGDEVLVSQQFSGRNVGDPSDLRVQFPPLANVRNHHLIILLRPLILSAIPLHVGIARDGGISLQAFYRSNQVSPTLTSHLKDPGFLLFWGGTIAVLQVLWIRKA